MREWWLGGHRKTRGPYNTVCNYANIGNHHIGAVVIIVETVGGGLQVGGWG